MSRGRIFKRGGRWHVWFIKNGFLRSASAEYSTWSDALDGACRWIRLTAPAGAMREK